MACRRRQILNREQKILLCTHARTQEVLWNPRIRAIRFVRRLVFGGIATEINALL